MTIEKGADWGVPGPAPPDVIVAADDADLARLVHEAVTDGRHLVARPGPGEVLATLGLAEPRTDEDSVAYPFDLGLAELDGGPPRPFVAHVVAGRRWWLGPMAVVMNCPRFGPFRLGPRAHPNDGLLDVTTGALPLSDIPEARRRARAGGHLPHPALIAHRVAEWEVEFDRRRSVRLDGRPVGSARHLAVRVEPDAFTVVA